MALTNIKIGFVMRGRDLQDTRSEFDIDCIVSDNRDLRRRKRAPAMFADPLPVARIIWVHSNTCITHQRLRPGGSDFEKGAWRLDYLITDIIKRSLSRHRDDFFIRQSRLIERVPIDHPLPAID